MPQTNFPIRKLLHACTHRENLRERRGERWGRTDSPRPAMCPLHHAANVAQTLPVRTVTWRRTSQWYGSSIHHRAVLWLCTCWYVCTLSYKHRLVDCCSVYVCYTHSATCLSPDAGLGKKCGLGNALWMCIKSVRYAFTFEIYIICMCLCMYNWNVHKDACGVCVDTVRPLAKLRLVVMNSVSPAVHDTSNAL